MAFIIDSKKIATNTVALYLRLGVTMVISFFVTRVTLQQLGVDDYGLNNLVGSIVSLFSFINSSMGTAVQRFYSIAIGEGNLRKLSKVFGVGLYLHIVIAFLSLFLAEIFALCFLPKLNIPTERMFAAQVVFQISVVSLCLNIINVPYSALLRAREMFSKTAVVEIIQAFLRLGVLFLLIHINYDKLITLSLLNLSITLLYLVSLCIMARKFEESHSRPIRDKELMSQMLSFISMLLVTVLAQLAKTKGIVVLINIFFGLAINAAYAVAVQVSNVVNTFVVSFKQSMVPQMMAAYGAGDVNAMVRIVNIGTKITFLLMLMITLPVIFEGQFILNIWLETPPAHSSKLVALVLISINLSSFTYFQYQGVHATGRILGQQILMSATFIINILIIYIVFRIGGSFESALYVNMVVSILQCGVNLYYARKLFNYSISSFVYNILLPCFGCLTAIIIIIIPIIRYLPFTLLRFTIVFLLCEFLICILGYFVVLDRIEKRYILNTMKKTGRLIGNKIE